jgi:hypothetical protein
MVLAALALPLVMACAGQEPGAATGASANAPAFSGDSAYAHVRTQVEFGPRYPGSDGHAAQLAWMQEYLRERADTVILQSFAHETVEGERLALTNLFARFRPEDGTRILLLAHWDTRPRADNERNTELMNEPILGANDGASGTAVLLELADVLSSHSPPIGVDLLFVDGEDWSSMDLLIGSEYFAANLPAGYRPLYGILLDMIGDTDPVYEIEQNSRDFAPEVVERVWRTAEEIGLGGVFSRQQTGYIEDDHVPLNRAGIRTIDIIDFDFGPGNAYWHTTQDRLENTSPKGLEAVGRVVTTLIYRGG